MVLERGITLIGSSRSGRRDFVEAVEFLEKYEDAQNQLKKLISAVITRMVLERGITLIGSSRSGRRDFVEAVEFLEKYEDAQNQLKKLISAVIDVKSINDMVKAFEYDLSTPFKTVMNWNI